METNLEGELEMIFYLKVNREERYTYRNLQHWIDAISFIPDSEIIIISDKKDVNNIIMLNVDFRGMEVRFIESIKNDDVRYVVENSSVESWWKAGYAHLSTFAHASENSIKEFWNIDADDTFVCLSPERTAELLIKAKTYANDNNIACFSLDMWRTVVKRLYGTDHWTFGVTYTDNSYDWWKIMRQFACDPGVQKLRLIKNIDCFFTFLSMQKDIKIESFYAENLKFIHYSDDFFKRPHCSGLYHFREGEILFPIIYYGFGAKKRGLLKVAADDICINLGITEEEQFKFMNQYAIDKITDEGDY